MDIWYQIMEWLITVIFIIIILMLICGLYENHQELKEQKLKEQNKKNNSQHY